MGIPDLASLVNSRQCDKCALHPLCKPPSIDIDDIERLAGLVLARRPIEAHASLFRAQDPARSLFISQSGSIKTVTINEAGDEQVIGFYFPGELIGLEGMGGGRFQTDAVALETAQVCEVPLAALERVAAQRPEFQRQVLRAMGEGMNRHTDHLKMLGRKNAQERLAMFLYGLSDRQQRLGHDPKQLHLSMSRADVGSYLSLAIETVSRCLSKLQDDGVIAVKGRHLRILQPVRLEQWAHCEEGVPVRRAHG